MRIRPLLLLTLALATACSLEPTPAGKLKAAQTAPARPGRDPACDEVDSAGQCTLYDVSLIALIARPSDYDGKRVRVVGFVKLEFEGNAMYVSREDHVHRISKNALWIDPPDSLHFAQDFTPRYMIAEGTFDAANTGHLNLFSGALTAVTRLEDWSGSSEPPRRVPSE